MIAILEFLVLLIVLPYILFGVLLAKIWEAVCAVFYPPLLLGGVWVGVIGCFLLPSMVPGDQPWVSVKESIAQSHVLNVQTPFVVFGLALCCVVASCVMRQRENS